MDGSRPEKASAQASASTKENEPVKEEKAQPPTSGWGDAFLKQNKAAGESADSAARAFLADPSLKIEQPRKTDDPADKSEPVKPAGQAGGWGELFLKQNAAASQTTDAATKAFLGDPSKPASLPATGIQQAGSLEQTPHLAPAVQSLSQYDIWASLYIRRGAEICSFCAWSTCKSTLNCMVRDKDYLQKEFPHGAPPPLINAFLALRTCCIS